MGNLKNNKKIISNCSYNNTLKQEQGRGPKIPSRLAKTPPRASKMLPRYSKMISRRPQDGPKTIPRASQDASNMLQRDPGEAQGIQELPKTAQTSPKTIS